MENVPSENKLKVLWYSDTPNCATGFATVARNLLRILHATGKYDFTCIGINHNGGPYDRNKFPYDIYPAINPLSTEEAYKDPYGRRVICDMAKTGFFDIVFMLQDTFIVETFLPSILEIRKKLPKEKQFALVYYFPIDGTPKKTWIENAIAKVDIPVTYTEFAKRECLKFVESLDAMKVIYHGVDKSVFFPPKDNGEFRKMFYPKHHQKFIILNVNRNQPRKDLHKTFAGFSEFHKKYPDSFLFMLCQANDVGGNILEIAGHYGLVWDEDWACPSPGNYGANQGYPVEAVNMIYGASDVVVSTTTGEGWGLSFSECAATQRIPLFPKNTSLAEMIGKNEERGYFIKSGETLNDYICMGSPDNNILRPIVNIYDMAEKLEYIYTHREEAAAKAKRAYDEIWTWDMVAEDWREVFRKAEQLVKVMRSSDISRNDLCPCGSGIKYKKCHGA